MPPSLMARFSGLRPGHHQAAALADDALRAGVVAFRRAALGLRGNFLQLLLEVLARREVRAGVRIGRLAAGLD